MSARPLILCCVALLAAGAAAAATTLDAIGSLETPAPRFWAPYSPQTLVVSDHDLRLVNWSAPEPRRDTLVRSFSLPPIGLEAFGDSVLVRFAGAEGLLGYTDFNGILAFEDVPANWHLPNVQIDGVGYRVLVEPLVYLIVLSAPGPGGILGLLDFSETIGQADVWAFAGDRAVLGNDDGLHVVSLANPLLPTIMATIEPPTVGWTASGLALREHTLFVRWGDRIESYDLDNPLNPVLLDQIAATEPSLTLGGRWLVAGDPESTAPLEVFDTADPAAMTARGILTSSLPRSDRIVVQDDLILLETAVGLNGYRIPAGTDPLVDLGYSWPLLEGTLLEIAGRTVWLQGTDRRYVVDLTGPGLATLQARPGREFELGTLAAVGGVLYFHRSGAGVHLEGLDDPLVPEQIAVLAPDPPLTCMDVAGTLLAGTSADGLALFSVTDPTMPTLLGQLALDGDLQRCLLFDDLVVVLAEVAGQPGLVHVVDAGVPDSPQLIATFTVDPDEDGAAWRPSQLVGRGDQVLVLCRDPQTALPSTTRTMVIDLADPSAPTRDFSAQDLDFWCYGPTDAHERDVVAAQRPARIGDRHVSFDGDQVTVFGYAGDPDAMTPQATWTAPGPVQRIAAVGNVLVVLTGQRLDVLTLSDSAPVAAPTPLTGPAVRVAPNPFNPRTSFAFTMPAAGTVAVGIHDARGRRVRTLRASLPAGPANLIWEGTDQAGRALPSGTYLVEIRTPHGVQTTRCALIR